MTWTSNKKTGEIRNQQGRLIATTELGQRQHTELLGQAMEMRKLLELAHDYADLPERIADRIDRVLNKTR